MSSTARVTIPGEGDNGKIPVYNEAQNRWDLGPVGPDLISSIRMSGGSLNPAIQAAFDAGRISLGDTFATAEFHGDSGFGGCRYRVVSASTGAPDGGSVIDGFTGFRLQAIFDPGPVSVEQFGALGDDATDDGPIFRKIVELFDGLKMTRVTTYLIADGLTVDKPGFTLEGVSALGSVMNFSGSSALVIGRWDDDTDSIEGGWFRNFTAKVASDADVTAITIDGFRRGGFSNVAALGAAETPVGALSTGWKISYSWLLELVSCYSRFHRYGVDVAPSAHRSAAAPTSLNAARFVGGEIQGNRQGMRLHSTSSVHLGMTVEGNLERGIETVAGNYVLEICCYFEKNVYSPYNLDKTNCDIYLGSHASATDQLVIVRSSSFRGESGVQDHCIYVNRAHCDIYENMTLGVNDMEFVGHTGDTYSRIRMRGNVEYPHLTAQISSETSVAHNQPDRYINYSVTNGLADRTFNADTVAIAELADVVATMLDDLGMRQ